jgi:hypothetical protein
MAFATRGGASWEEGFVHAAASTLLPVLERPATAAGDTAAGALGVDAAGMNPLSGMLSPKRMRADQSAGSAYAPNLARALKAVVKVRGWRASVTVWTAPGLAPATAPAGCAAAVVPRAVCAAASVQRRCSVLPSTSACFGRDRM